MVDGVYWLPIGGPAAEAGWLGPKVGGHRAPFLYSSCEPSELSQWLCDDDSAINIVIIIIIINSEDYQNCSVMCYLPQLYSYKQNTYEQFLQVYEILLRPCWYFVYMASLFLLAVSFWVFSRTFSCLLGQCKCLLKSPIVVVVVIAQQLSSVVQVEEVCDRSWVVPQVLHCKLRLMALTAEQMLYGVWCHSTLRTNI